MKIVNILLPDCSGFIQVVVIDDAAENILLELLDDSKRYLEIKRAIDEAENA